VAELATAIETASRASAAFDAESKKLAACVPDGARLPVGLQPFEFLINGQSLPVGLAIATATEMFRTGAAPHLRLPGAKAPTLQLANAAHLIESMVSALQRVNEAILANVRGQVERAEAAETKALAS
jgi:hypothetical protein